MWTTLARRGVERVQAQLHRARIAAPSAAALCLCAAVARVWVPPTAALCTAPSPFQPAGAGRAASADAAADAAARATPPSVLECHARDIFGAALEAAEPGKAVRVRDSKSHATHTVARALTVDGDLLTVADGPTYDLKEYDEVFLVGFGKASYPMAQACIHLVGVDRISQGHVVTKDAHLPFIGAGSFLVQHGNVTFSQAAHPVPNQAGVRGAEKIKRLLASATERTLVICVVSGGASALLCSPAPGLTLEHLQATSQALLATGASIDEMNAIRKHLSSVKGGQLAGIASPATMLTLVLSDVVGDSLSVIASGPTVPDPSTFADCWSVVTRYGLHQGSRSLPDAVLQRLQAGVAGQVPDTPKPGDATFHRCCARIVASNAEAVDAAARRARELGYNTTVLSTRVEGEAREVAKVYSAVLKEAQDRELPAALPACILAGGETTVTITGSGKGGRSQELALAAAIELHGMEGVALLAGGTDGTDGPTDAAGAVVTGTTVADAWRTACTGAASDESRTDATPIARARRFLTNNDAYNYFDQAGQGLLKTGPTGTNVMDVAVGLVKRQ